jgi:hypothetical protein
MYGPAVDDLKTALFRYTFANKTSGIFVYFKA